MRRLRTVMLAATQLTRHYERYSYDVRHSRLSEVADCLRRIEPVDLIDFLKHSDRYRNPKAWPPGRRRLRQKLAHSSRTAILSPHFYSGIQCRSFPNPWLPALSRYDKTGALTVVNTHEGTTWLVGQSIVPPVAGTPPVQPVQISLPPNVTVNRKTWVQLR